MFVCVCIWWGWIAQGGSAYHLGLSMNGFSSLPSTVPRRLRYDSFWQGWITWGGRLIVGTIDGRAPASVREKRIRTKQGRGLWSEPELCARDAVRYAHDTLVDLGG